MTTDAPATETIEAPAQAGHTRSPSTITLTRCRHCSIRVRNEEMAIHAAHAHNIGASTGKDKSDRGRGRRSR